MNHAVSSYLVTSGLIANADNEIVQLVEDMVISHITGNCLILVALPMTGIYTEYIRATNADVMYASRRH